MIRKLVALTNLNPRQKSQRNKKSRRSQKFLRRLTVIPPRRKKSQSNKRERRSNNKPHQRTNSRVRIFTSSPKWISELERSFGLKITHRLTNFITRRLISVTVNPVISQVA